MQFILPLLSAAPALTPGNGNNGENDDLSHPLGDRQRAMHQQAMIEKINGNAYGRTHEVARGQFVELERTGEDSIWTVLGEFNDFPHNNIAKPDRAIDNTTHWVPDFNRDHYMNLLFSDAPGNVSMRNFYIELSSNRYTVNGDVTDWVSVPGNAASYDDDLGGGALGSQAVWSHRWYARFNLIGSDGPSPDYLLGGVQVGAAATGLETTPSSRKTAVLVSSPMNLPTIWACRICIQQ